MCNKFTLIGRNLGIPHNSRSSLFLEQLPEPLRFSCANDRRHTACHCWQQMFIRGLLRKGKVYALEFWQLSHYFVPYLFTAKIFHNEIYFIANCKAFYSSSREYVMYFNFVLHGTRSFQPRNEIGRSLDLIHFSCFL